MKLNQQRLIDTFLELVQIDSESFHEKKIHGFLVSRLKELGCRVYVDKAGSAYNTDAPGNIIAFLPGTAKSKPVVLCMLGCCLGIFLSWAVLQIVNTVVASLDMSFSLNLPVVLIAVVFCFIIGLVFGLYPANKAHVP